MRELLLLPLFITAPADAPISLDAVRVGGWRDAAPQVQLSEAIQRAPGMMARSRENFAQDLQLSSRGFGSRAAFGVRGLRLYSDGVPLTMPDGQSQTGTLDLWTAESVELLRGPFSALLGNAAGGALLVRTETGGPHAAAGRLQAGSWGARRAAFKASGPGYGAAVSRFETGGFRAHSAATRDAFHSKTTVGPATLVVDALRQEAQDPLGLTRAQVEADPRAPAPAADLFNTRKTVEHAQAGLILEGEELRLLLYGGRRGVLQYQAVPVAAQAAPTSPGGVVDLDRSFGGADLSWRRAGFAVGASWDGQRDRRRGFQNFDGPRLGVKGALRRDEIDTVQALAAYAQARFEPHERWRLDAGVRAATLRFALRDRFTAAGNPDDSGSRRFSALSPAAGVLFRAAPWLRLYASGAGGFETPTFDELAYRPDGSPGLNPGLRPARSRHYEAGAKTDRARLALFQADTRDEIVVFSNTGGRSTFTNAARTRRRGAELSAQTPLGAGFAAHLAATWLEARYRPSGRRLPGAPDSFLFSELSWERSGLATAFEAARSGRVFVNDANSQSAAPYGRLNWRAAWSVEKGDWTFGPFVRVDNVTDTPAIGSVIVAETAGRFYEPAPARAWTAGLNVTWFFQGRHGKRQAH